MNMDWIQQIIVQCYTYGVGVCAGVVVSALNFRSEGWFEAQSLPSHSINLTPKICHSPPRCINGYR